MKKLLLLLTLVFIMLSSCKKELTVKHNGKLNAGLPSKPQASIPVNNNGIIQKTILSKDTIWKIDGISAVEPGSTLTIEPGTHIIAGKSYYYYDEESQNMPHIKGVLVVPRKAEILAEGTATQPIVFTSDKAPEQRKAGDFGGIILLGNAPINNSRYNRIEGLPFPMRFNTEFGGNDTADNSGSLKYVRIEFPGYILSQDNSINGLTCGGVGSGTTLENIQISWSRDDAFEFFGGTVSAKYLVALSTQDDDFDFNLGYSGTIQYALSLKDPNSTYSTLGNPRKSDSNGLESDNHDRGYRDVPTTRPMLRNFTFIGIQDASITKVNLKYGNRWRRATSLDIMNSIIAGYDVGATFENINPTDSEFSFNVVHAYSKAFIGNVPGRRNLTEVGNNAGSYLNLAGGNDIFYSTNNAANFAIEALVPIKGSIAYGDGSTTFKGAFNPSGKIWTLEWTEWQPKTY